MDNIQQRRVSSIPEKILSEVSRGALPPDTPHRNRVPGKEPDISSDDEED